MTTAWKYVMFKDRNGRRFPVIFPAEMTHKTVADAIEHSVRMDEVEARVEEYSCPEPISAGFIGGVTVLGICGDSETLDLAPNPDDDLIINAFRHHRGVV
jgi:hypothetical protein